MVSGRQEPGVPRHRQGGPRRKQGLRGRRGLHRPVHVPRARPVRPRGGRARWTPTAARSSTKAASRNWSRFAQEQGRFAETIPVLEPLVERQLDNVQYRVWLMRAYWGTKQQGKLLAELKRTDAYFHEQGRWQEGVMAALAGSCLENGLSSSRPATTRRRSRSTSGRSRTAASATARCRATTPTRPGPTPAWARRPRRSTRPAGRSSVGATTSATATTRSSRSASPPAGQGPQRLRRGTRRRNGQDRPRQARGPQGPRAGLPPEGPVRQGRRRS